MLRYCIIALRASHLWFAVMAANMTLLGIVSPSDGSTFTFTRIADSNTVAPGSTSNFELFGGPATDGTNLSFFSIKADGGWGAYRTVNGSLQLIADQNTPIPGGTGNFQQFGRVYVQDDKVAFTGGRNFNSMLFTGDANGITRLLPDPVLLSGTVQTLVNFKNISFVGDDLGISAEGDVGGRGIFTLIDGNLELIADNTTSIPGGSGVFLGFSDVDFDGADVAFEGVGTVVKRPDREGIYTNRNGVLELVANQGTAPPAEPLNTFDAFDRPRIDGGTVYFRANYDFGAVDGIYSDSGSGIGIEVDTQAASFPFGGGGRFTETSYRWVDGGNLLVAGFDTLNPGIESRYLRYNGEWHVIIRRGDVLDGVAVQDINDAALHGDMVVLTLDMADGVEAIYTVIVPEPTSLSLLAVGGLTVLRRRVG